MACNCGKGGKVLKTEKLGKADKVDICICNIQWLNFTDGPGVAQWDTDEEVNSLTRPGDPYTKIWFRCGDLVGGAKGFMTTPGWNLDIGIGTDGPSGSDVWDNWQIGIIQTVESEVWQGYYEDDWGRIAMANKSRDGDKSATAPWYAPSTSSADGHPIFVKDLGGAVQPTISDDPQASFGLFHADAPCKQLVAASIKGTYHLWLVALDSKAPISDAATTYLWHATIVVDKQWERKWGDDPQLLPSWKATGKQTKKDIGFGKGSRIPILTGPVANDQLIFSTNTHGKPCPKSSDKKP